VLVLIVAAPALAEVALKFSSFEYFWLVMLGFTCAIFIAGADPLKGMPGPTHRMPDFVVHLRDAEVDRYARLSFEVELASEEEKAKFEKFGPRIRDGFISYLSDRTLEELRGSEQVKKVKTTLHEALKELAPGVRIRALYITDLVIQ